MSEQITEQEFDSPEKEAAPYRAAFGEVIALLKAGCTVDELREQVGIDEQTEPELLPAGTNFRELMVEAGHWQTAVLAVVFHEILKDHDAESYVELEITPKHWRNCERLLVTLQRVEGERPGIRAARLAEERDRYREALERIAYESSGWDPELTAREALGVDDD